MFKSKLFWGGASLCGVVILLGILIHNANQPQETITIYKTVTPAQRVKSQSDKLRRQTSEDIIKTKDASTPMDSEVATDTEDFTSEEPQFSDAETQTDESILSADIEAESVAEPEEKRFYGLTIAEIEERIPVLEEEIRTNLTKAVELYAELRRTDGMASKSPPYFSAEIATWRDETWKEVKRLFHDVANTGKIMNYTSYLKVTGGDNPLLPGGWISELMKPLPMRVTYNGTSQ